MTLRHYILGKDKQVVPASLMDWATFMERADRTVGKTSVSGFEVSTVFLGLDHNFSGEGPPVLWETMVFSEGGRADFDCRRCAGSIEQAEAMHEEVARQVEQVCGITRTPA